MWWTTASTGVDSQRVTKPCLRLEWLVTHIVFQKPQRIVGKKRQDGGGEGRGGEKNTNVLIGPGTLPDSRQPIVIG